ncbi:MAG: PT domain-containing protein, partial [Lachnospiraceae bacterium]|nr:PT domain-containing protein [Lachnospiraceae bacterium]
MKKLKNFLLHALSIFLIILSLGAFSFSAFSGILVLLAGMLCSPLLRRVIEKRLGKRLKGIVLYIGAAVLFLVGIMSTPTSDSPDLGKEVIAESTVDFSETQELIASPTPTPTWKPTASPALSPTNEPTALPTQAPTKDPIATPMLSPTKAPAKEPTAKPTDEPTAEPTLSPTKVPTQAPVEQPVESTVQNPANSQTQTV